MAGQEGIEAIKARLGNIRSVEPILGAMRTISLGSWQAALKRKERVLAYSERLLSLLHPLAPHLGSRRRRPRRATEASAPTLVIVIGSERGLCGAFNSSLVHYVEDELARFADEGLEVELHSLGTRVTRALARVGLSPSSSRALPMAALPSSELATTLMLGWLAQYEGREIDAVYAIYHAYRNSVQYEPTTLRLIPPPVPVVTESAYAWPAPYIDSDPTGLFVRTVVLWSTAELYRILLDSAASEHSARYQLMEGATRNSERLIEELTLALQAARQQAITAEMQELAAGAGLLGG
jgi:F-type H+-transporting ATPase subunit gamma